MISKFIKTRFKSVLVLGALLAGSSINAQLGITWTEMGPNDVGGRSRAIIIDKNDPTHKTLYAASVSGGIFKSTDNGGNWQIINDQAQALNVSCMAQNSAGDIIFGTGETFGRGDNGGGFPSFIGTGLYKLTVSNGSVALISATADSSKFGNVNEIAISSGGNIYVAANKGLFTSTDGGSTFTQEAISGTLAAMDVKLSKDEDVYFSAGYKDGTSSKVYFKSSASSSFTDITPSSITNRGRIEIAPSPVDNNYVYLSIAKQKTTGLTGGLSAVLVSSDKGTTWKVISLGTAQFDPLSVPTPVSTYMTYVGYGDYANTIVASKTNKEQVYLAGQFLYRWDQIVGNSLGQGDWTMIGNPAATGSQLFLHSKIHDIKFSPTDPNVYFVATDGGLFRAAAPPTGFPLYYTPFMPINKNFRTGQFNSVAFPIYPLANQNTSNQTVPYAGLAGGSMGSGLVYIPGYLNTTQTSNSFGTGDAGQSEFSKIVPKAVFNTSSYGVVTRSSDIDVTAPSSFYDNSYKGGNGSPGNTTFANENTPMRLWENDANLDSAIFYNETNTTSFTNNNATKISFVVKNSRQQTSTKYDSILISAVNTGTAPSTQTIQIIPTYSGNNLTGLTVLGDANTSATSNNTIFINANLKDSIRFTFNNPPQDPALITVTFKFRYDAGDTIKLENTDISGGFFNTTAVLTSSLGSGSSPFPLVKIPLAKSARMAVGISAKSGDYPSVFVVKRPLSFANNPDWVKIAGKNSRIDGPGGVPTSSISPVLGTTVTRLEWSNDGTNIYFSTKANDTTFYLYRISHLEFIGDSSAMDYSGTFSSDIDSTSTAPRKKMSQRTTAIGKFRYPITGIAVLSNDTGILVTTGGYNNKTATVYMSNSNVRKMSMNNSDDSNFNPKNGTTLPVIPAYTGIFEMNDNKRVLVGTENGIYSTTDITNSSPSWAKETGGGFPANIPVMQIRQQKIASYKCYNSGIIYVATAGRGLWSTDKYLTNYAIGIEENEQNLSFNSNIKLFPNPANDAASLWFNAKGDASYKITVYDVSGRTLIDQTTGKLMEGEQLISLNTSKLNSGVYFVTITGTNNFNATTKMVIAK